MAKKPAKRAGRKQAAGMQQAGAKPAARAKVNAIGAKSGKHTDAVRPAKPATPAAKAKVAANDLQSVTSANLQALRRNLEATASKRGNSEGDALVAALEK